MSQNNCEKCYPNKEKSVIVQCINCKDIFYNPVCGCCGECGTSELGFGSN